MMNNSHQKPTPQEQIELLNRQINTINRLNIKLKKDIQQVERERDMWIDTATKLQGRKMK